LTVCFKLAESEVQGEKKEKEKELISVGMAFCGG
jgi:hypothetical protein